GVQTCAIPIYRVAAVVRREIQPDLTALREVEHIGSAWPACHVDLVVAVAQELHLRCHVPKLGVLLQFPNGLEAGNGPFVQAIARRWPMEAGAGAAADEVAPEPLDTITIAARAPHRVAASVDL